MSAERSTNAEPIELVREEKIRERVAAIFARRREELEAMLPGARVEHIGSTAVPGSLTKGDLDICLIVGPEEFEPASRALAGRFRIHQPENWSPTPASFTAPPEEGIDVGVQLVPICAQGEESARADIDAVGAALDVIDPDWPLVAAAASIKARGGLSQADAFCIATALTRDAPLWTGGPEILGQAGALSCKVVDLRS